jgi:serine/threonine-protein kinase
MNHQVNQFTHIFNEALDLPAQERENYVKQLCGSDAELFARIMDLLKSADEASLFFNDLQQDMYGSLATSPDLTDLELLNYKISDKLGEGGMATVYKAQRIDGLYDHEVAIKVFDKGGHHPELAQRFEAERSILAALAHPNIAKILDAGVTPQGAPFYILEYIMGHNV